MRSAKGGRSVSIAISDLIHTFGQVTRFLELNGEEERARRIVTLSADAVSITIARRDLGHPEVKTALIRKSVQEVNVLLVDEEIRVVNGNGSVRAGSQA